MVGLFELLGLIVIFAAIVLPVCLVIYYEYKNKMAIIEKGIVPEDEKYRPEGKVGWGIAILGIGISFVAARLFNLDAIATGGLILTSIGMALLVSYKISKQQQ
jgi:hypothetical protein